MNRGKKGALVLLLAGLLLVGGFVAFRVLWFDPNMNIGDGDWLTVATRPDLNDEACKVLWWPWGNHHDACILLARFGDSDSIPCMLNGMKWAESEADPPHRLPDCTHAHCREALEMVTGQKVGWNHAEWEEWWEKQ